MRDVQVHPEAPQRQAIVTGGAGFVGTNLCAHLLSRGARVTIFDNLSRRGTEANLAWLRRQFGSERLHFIRGDVRDARAVRTAVQGHTEIYHFAAQVAVTTSIDDPRLDFEVNAAGTLNVLEAARATRQRPFVLFTSTNKVYGAITEKARDTNSLRYELSNCWGIAEDQPLDFHSPYGCSKGAADQYVRDYGRVYGLPTVVFRMSCIYGPHQFGTEDQGWVAHFAITSLLSRPLSIYGDGRQVRDILYVDDLIAAMQAAYQNRERIASQAFNIGGGPENAISLLEVIREFNRLSGRKISIEYGSWRVGDQKVYVTDIRRFQQATGWKPRVNAREGVRRLYRWLSENRLHLAEAVAEAQALAG